VVCLISSVVVLKESHCPQRLSQVLVTERQTNIFEDCICWPVKYIMSHDPTHSGLRKNLFLCHCEKLTLSSYKVFSVSV